MLIIFLKTFLFGHEHKHNGISSITAMLRILLYGQKKMGHETDNVYRKSSPIFCS